MSLPFDLILKVRFLPPAAQLRIYFDRTSGVSFSVGKSPCLAQHRCHRVLRSREAFRSPGKNCRAVLQGTFNKKRSFDFCPLLPRSCIAVDAFKLFADRMQPLRKNAENILANFLSNCLRAEIKCVNFSFLTFLKDMRCETKIFLDF